MFNEAQNADVTKVALDTVFFQEFSEDQEQPGIATALTADLFKPVETEHSAYIGEVNKPVGLFSKVGEAVAIPLGTPRVTNKYTITVNKFAQRIVITKELFDDNIKKYALA